MPDIRALLLDVEGTTTPLDFVTRVLFPDARAHVRDFLGRRAGETPVQADLALLRSEHEADARGGQSPPPWPDGPGQARLEGAVAYVHWLMDRDRKSTGLKSLQGKVWEEGYRAGRLRGQVYADVPRAFARWRAHGRDVAIFSSGSVLAQKLIFSRSDAGDLSAGIRAYFDTTTGPKREPESYCRIAAARGRAPTEWLFLSDVGEELDAARAAGMQTALVVRPGAPEPGAASHPLVRSFDELPPV